MNRILFLAALILIGYGVNRLYSQVPPMPQFAAQVNLGRQNPYMSTATALVTQTVTYVYQFKYLRSIERTTNENSLETNYMLMRTNLLLTLTNTSPINPSP